MRPGFHQNDTANGGLVYPECRRKIDLAFSSGVSFSDFPDLVLCEDRLGGLGASSVFSVTTANPSEDADGMEAVFTGGADLEIFEPVIVFDAVEVVYHQSIGNGAVKGFPNKTMDVQGFRTLAGTEGDDRVTLLASRAFDNPAPSAYNTIQVGEPISLHPVKSSPSFFCHVDSYTTKRKHIATRVTHSGIPPGRQ